MAAPGSDIDKIRLQRQLRFFQDRSEWHAKQERHGKGAPAHDIWAAALEKEAAAAAIILEEYATAKSMLNHAADSLTKLGVFSGYQLRTIADRHPPFHVFLAPRRLGEEMFDLGNLGEIIRNWAKQEYSYAPEEGEAYFTDQSFSSSYQLLCLYQFFNSMKGRNDSIDELSYIIRKGISRRPVFEVGNDGLSSIDYLALLERVSIFRSDIIFDESLDYLFKARNLKLSNAKRDEYHWKMMTSPTKLLDFDLLIIALASIDNGNDAFVRSEAERRDYFVGLPFSVALRLRG